MRIKIATSDNIQNITFRPVNILVLFPYYLIFSPETCLHKTWSFTKDTYSFSNLATNQLWWKVR